MTRRNFVRGTASGVHRARIASGCRVLLALTIVSTILSQAAAQSVKQEPQIIGIRIGFDNLYKVGQWTPAEVMLLGGVSTTTGRVTITANDGDGVPAVMPTIDGRPTQVIAGGQATAPVMIRLGSTETSLTVRYAYDEGHESISREYTTSTMGTPDSIPSPYDTSQEIIVSVGPSIGLEEAAKLSGEGYGDSTVAQLTDASQLPTRWYGYDGVDFLVLSTSRPEVYAALVPGDARHTALLKWVEMGGRVILCVGENAPEVLADDAPLAALVDGQFVRMVTRQGFEAGEIGTTLEAYSEKRTPIRGLALGDEKQAELSVPLIEGLDGIVELKQGELPLVIRTVRGFGTVTIVTLDLDRPPFAGWDSRGRVVNKLMGKPIEMEIDEDSPATMMANYWGGLSGQLRDGLEQFEGVRLVPFWIVAALVIFYIILIGPVDYFFVKKVLKRMELTWITFPSIVLMVSVGAYFLAFWLKGDQMRVNQVDIVDLDLDSGLVRGTSWMNTFSPRVQSLDLGIVPRLPGGGDTSRVERIVSWMGIPGVGLGGMSSGYGSSSIWSSGYAFSPQLDRMLGAPIQVWSTKAFTARWRGFEQGTLDATLGWSEAGVLEGMLTNNLDQTLEEAVLLAKNRAYEIGDLEPGEPVSLTAENTWRQRNTWLNIQAGLESTPFNPWSGQMTSRDVAQVVKWMMFSGASEGSDHIYPNRYQRFIDLSAQLDINRAVLLCRSQREGADFIDGQRVLGGPLDRRWTYYRFVIHLSTPEKQEN